MTKSITAKPIIPISTDKAKRVQELIMQFRRDVVEAAGRDDVIKEVVLFDEVGQGIIAYQYELEGDPSFVALEGDNMSLDVGENLKYPLQARTGFTGAEYVELLRKKREEASAQRTESFLAGQREASDAAARILINLATTLGKKIPIEINAKHAEDLKEGL